MIAALAVVVLLWLAVVWCRHDIRVRWWGWRLEHSTTVAGRLYYLQLLAGAGERALVVARDLLATDEAALRSFGVALANSIPGEESLALLKRACHDPDADVRESAITGLSMRPSPQVLRTLRELADHSDIETAMWATSRLTALDSPEALSILRELARTHAEVGVRAQAIDSLAEWGGDQVVDALIACLTDEAVFGRLTASQRGAAEALTHVAPHLVEGDSVETIVGVDQSNGARAARALRAVTGQTFGYVEAKPDARRSAVAAWREWRRRSNVNVER